MPSIKDRVVARGIKFLFHFTNIENLDSILLNGLMPRQTLEEAATDAHTNDILRLDGCMEASCVSIGFPNYKMFYKYRCENIQNEWTVLAINPMVLWTKDCAFCSANAASAAVTSIPLAERKQKKAFESMFAEIPDKPTRNEMNIPPNLPTDPQAEVLVFDQIDPDLILGAAFTKSTTAQIYRDKYTGFQFISGTGLFNARHDHAYWR